jgi:hypothetical protein
MKCTECGREFVPDYYGEVVFDPYEEEDICPECQVVDLPEAQMQAWPEGPQPPHPSIVCSECDGGCNESCELCRGSGQYCPVCCCPIEECEFQEG